MRGLWVSVSIIVLSVAAARADYPTEQANEKLRQIEAMFDRFKKPAWFDGKQVTGTPEVRDADNAPRDCRNATTFYERTFPSIAPKLQQIERAQAATKRYTELTAYCDALAAAAGAYVKNASAKQAQADASKAADQAAEADRKKRVIALLDDMGDGRIFAGDYASLVDPRFTGGQLSGSPEIVRMMRERAKLLAAACAKAGPIPDPAPAFASNSIFDYPSVMCAMPARADELIQKGRHKLAMLSVSTKLDGLRDDIRNILDGRKKGVLDLLQLRMFDKAAFTAEMDKSLEKLFAEIGEKVPAGVWDVAFPEDAELKAKIDQDGTTKTFEMPPNKDGAAEKLVIASWPKELPGVKIKKIGTDYNTWVAYDEKTLVASDARYNYYKVNAGKNRYKRGWALLEIPGRPYCQAREWIVSRVYNGPIQIDWLAKDGHFMKCP